jgi:hypothetical protein
VSIAAAAMKIRTQVHDRPRPSEEPSSLRGNSERSRWRLSHTQLHAPGSADGAFDDACKTFTSPAEQFKDEMLNNPDSAMGEVLRDDEDVR